MFGNRYDLKKMFPELNVKASATDVVDGNSGSLSASRSRPSRGPAGLEDAGDTSHLDLVG